MLLDFNIKLFIWYNNLYVLKMKKFKVMIYVYSIKFIKSGMIILRFVGFF